MDFKNRILDIAYSKVDSSVINTVKHYLFAADCGFPALKGDIRPTKDGGLIMCHDEGFSRNAQGQVTLFHREDYTPISSLAFQECLALVHEGENEHIASYEDFVRVCAEKGKICFTTIRGENIPQATAEMFRIIRKYNMEDRLIVNSFTYESLVETRKYSSTVPVSNVQKLSAVLDKKTVDRVRALGNGIVNMFSFNPHFHLCEFNEDSLPAMEYAKENGIPLFQAIVSTKEQYDKALRYGFTGFQINSLFTPYPIKNN